MTAEVIPLSPRDCERIDEWCPTHGSPFDGAMRRCDRWIHAVDHNEPLCYCGRHANEYHLGSCKWSLKPSVPPVAPNSPVPVPEVGLRSYADPEAQREIERLRAKVARVEALGKRLVWDRTVNKTAHVARLMLECVGVDPRQAMRERLGEPIPQVDPASLLRRIGERRDSALDAPLTHSEPSSLPTAPGTPTDATGGAE